MSLNEFSIAFFVAEILNFLFSFFNSLQLFDQLSLNIFFLCIAKPFELITVGISFIFMPFLKCKIYNFRFFNSAPYKCTVHIFGT